MGTNLRDMKKLVLAIGFVIASSINVFGQQTDTVFIDTNSAEFKKLRDDISQIMSVLSFFEPKEYKDHTHLKNNMMKILLSNDNSELFSSIDEQKQWFGSITYFNIVNGVIVNANSIVPYDEPNVTVYNTTTLYTIINDLKLNYPKNKSFKPDVIKISEYNDTSTSLIWVFENNKIEYKLEILFKHTQINQITFISNIAG
jgi:hypothetical protein